MSTAASAGPRAPGRPFAALVDDAAIFPPGNAAMPNALRAHVEHRQAWYAGLVGGFVCSDTRLPELQEALTAVAPGVQFHVNLTIVGGAGAIEPALTWIGRDERLALDVVEVALRDEADLAHNAARMTTVLAGCLPDDATAFVEMPRVYGAELPTGWSAALDEVAASGHQMKYRTGGPDSAAFPSAAEVVAVVDACLDRELPFKCTAGLHHAVRHTAADSGFEHHGFLNVLLLTRGLLDGCSADEGLALLEERDRGTVAERVRGLGDDGIAATRRWFTSFGSCSVAEPVDDLLDLGLISKG